MRTTVHRCLNSVVVTTVVNCRSRRSSELCLMWFSNLSKKLRADERTRTADLLITSDRSCVAGVCLGLQIPISRRLFLHWVAECCTVLRSRWYQSGINSRFVFAFDVAFCQAGTHFVTAELVLTSVH